MTDLNRIALLGKLRKAKRLAESARWELLDVVIFLNAVETELTTSESNGELRGGLLGEDESHEDYQPGDLSEQGQ